ncbi:phosphoenolpyruvate carboxykinase (ATP) [Candidatus Desulforudis audaxviator]|uniref:phosphoenolpyruvate carboxykinase (ATP) n=1 Tax=Desulforudis audaxviator (strain MP104C) TaxID=477974 RepID=B1I536_DESAP|nr:phosphoenolpyruvate carboxykinase (ATP) [Candidatus Desulforudis audaxviator]ACA60065.1 Phosphoenolpyruvate carboxykinase (ATP) [Candidatus Desulforudis audaxviator MP104C]AZK60103.1 Phosphoenolpyruvate carboxykinase [ATP] [Candidatus Desulforudis audaxviator]
MHRFRRPVEARTIIDNPPVTALREMTHDGQNTEYGSVNYLTRVRNRSAKQTYIVEDGVQLGADQQGISLEKAEAVASEVHRYLRNRTLIRLDRQIGRHPDFSLHCRFYVSAEYARIPLQWHNMLFEPVDRDAEPDLVSIQIPEWPEKIIFCHPLAGVTYILGSDYFGECKKSFLRKAMYLAKKRGFLGFHAGSKVLKVRDRHGVLKKVGFILFGLSGTGKTTLTMHNHGLTGGEDVAIRQDDVLIMNPAGYCYGTENGFYIKTEGLDASQCVLYRAATSPNAIFENVCVDGRGHILFDNCELTSNGRGVILRSDVLGTDDKIDLDKVHRIIFITRRDDVVPAVARLNAEQAAAYFMLGESIETSAGDPTKAGEPKREVGTNPFIIGPESEEGNRLLEILKANPDIECYILNTGSVGKREGDPGTNITVRHSAHLMTQIARGSIKWTSDPDWGYLIPTEVPGMNIRPFDPRLYYSTEEYARRVDRLREERRAWLARYPNLKPSILKAVEPPRVLATAASAGD